MSFKIWVEVWILDIEVLILRLWNVLFKTFYYILSFIIILYYLILWIDAYFRDDAKVWWCSLDSRKMDALSDEEFEQVFLDKWSHAKNKYQVEHKGLFSILKFHGCIQKENIVVSISLSCKHNFIHVNLAKNCKFLPSIFKAHRLMVKIFKFLKIWRLLWINMCCIHNFII